MKPHDLFFKPPAACLHYAHSVRTGLPQNNEINVSMFLPEHIHASLRREDRQSKLPDVA